MKTQNKYDVVIFDMDGTLLDSRGKGEIEYEWAYEAFRKSLLHYGIGLTKEKIDLLFLGPFYEKGAEGVKNFCDKFHLQYDEFWWQRERDAIEAKKEAIKEGGIKLHDGAEDIIEYLSHKGYTLAVVSAAQQECVDFTLEFFKLSLFFEIWYGRSTTLEELGKIKPNPYYLNKVLKELNTRRAIVVDDGQMGILAAKRAGSDSIFVYKNKDEEIKHKATYLIKNISEIRSIL